MAYAPILDPASYTSEAEPRRQLALAAAGLLQRLAGDLGTFREAVNVTAPARTPLDSSLESVRSLLLKNELVPPINGPDDQVLMQLLEQLQQVRAFSELDGGSLEAHIGSIARMIQGGRVELFAGRSAKASRHSHR